MASAPLRARVLDDRAAEPHARSEVRLTLKAPPQHSTFMFQSTSSAPQALMTSSIEHRLLGVVAAADLRRADEQAAVVGGQLDAVERVGLGQRRGDLLLDESRPRSCSSCDGVEHLDGVGERAAEDLGHAARRGRRPRRRRGAPPRGGCSRRRRAPARGRSPAPRPAPGCGPAGPRRAGGRWCGRCSRRSSSSRGSRRGRCRAPRRRRAGSRRTRARCRAASSRGSRRGRGRSAPRGVRGCGVRRRRCSRGHPALLEDALDLGRRPSILSARRLSLPRANMPGALVTSFMRSPVCAACSP